VGQSPSVEATRRGVVYLVVSAAAYGSLVVLIKWAVAAGINAETALALRFTLAAVVWWAILVARGRSVWPGARRAGRAAGIGALFYAPNALAYYQGTARVSGAVAAMVIAAVPVVVAVLAWLLLSERPGHRGWLALALAVVGGLMLAGGPKGPADPVGFLWLGAAVLLYSLYIVVSKPVTRTFSPSVATSYVITGAAVSYWLWGGLAGRLDFGFAPVGWVAILSMALISTVVAVFAFLVGVQIVGATGAAVVNALEPVVGTVLSILLLGDRIRPSQMVGGALIILAAVLVQRERARTPRFGATR
jgi:drug/metabolite transporter (DMT)-like permease